MKTFLDYVKSNDSKELKRQVEHLSKMASEHEEKANAALMMGDRDGHALHMAKHNHFKTQHENLKSGLKEEVEQIDEISKETLSSYASKAKAKANQMASKHHEIVKKDMATGDFSASKKSHAKIAKLDRGVLKAGQKLQKKAADAHAVATQGPKKPSNQFKTPPQGYKAPGSDRPYWGEETDLNEVAAWQRKEGKSESGGLNKKGIASYRRENPGSKLSMAVTTKPSKLKPGSKAANRRKSFCARMGGMKKRLTSAKTARDPDSRINKALRKWNC